MLKINKIADRHMAYTNSWLKEAGMLCKRAAKLFSVLTLQ